MGSSAVTSRMRRMHPSKSVSISTNDPFAMGCTSCASEILSAGRNTIEGMPAAAAYALSAAEVCQWKRSRQQREASPAFACGSPEKREQSCQDP